MTSSIIACILRLDLTLYKDSHLKESARSSQAGYFSNTLDQLHLAVRDRFLMNYYWKVGKRTNRDTQQQHWREDERQWEIEDRLRGVDRAPPAQRQRHPSNRPARDGCLAERGGTLNACTEQEHRDESIMLLVTLSYCWQQERRRVAKQISVRAY